MYLHIYFYGVICGFAYLGVLCIAFIALYIYFDRVFLACAAFAEQVSNGVASVRVAARDYSILKPSSLDTKNSLPARRT